MAILRNPSAVALWIASLAVACGGGGSSSTGDPNGGGRGGKAGAGGSSAGTSSAAAGSGASSGKSGAGGSNRGGSSTGGEAAAAGAGGSSRAGSSATPSIFYAPPDEIIGGPCEGTPALPIGPCTYAPEQVYCSLNEPSRGIMAVCSTSGRSQCEVVDECEPGWHACTATDYVARGGRDVPPSFSSNTDRAWLAACVRDASGTQLKNEPCSVCGQDPGFAPSIQWWCDGEVVYEGGMEGDALGVLAAPECMRVGVNTASHAAFWSMSFADGAPNFVMCCLDEP